VLKTLINSISLIVNIAAVIIMIFLITSIIVANTSNSGNPQSIGELFKPQTTQTSSSSESLSIKEDVEIKSNTSSSSNLTPLKSESVVIPTFTGDQFKSIYKNQKYSNTTISNEAQEVTGYPLVDQYIRDFAPRRGFSKQPLADESKLIEFQGYRIQPQAATSFQKVQDLAAKVGIKITLVSAYRSPIEQKIIFAPIMPVTYIEEELLAGTYDQILNEGMNTIAPPGFSRHHTGYAMDFGCDTLEVTKFRDTPCYAWLRKNNFKVLIDNNIIPSYPEGVTLQGPAPEEWEFVYVDNFNY
jgi:LAS superfamily LD-carboxypeptidase LdcB